MPESSSGGDLVPVVDDTLCLGYGFCEERAPLVFALDGANCARVRDDRPDTDADRALVDAAIAECPTQAIRWASPHEATE